MGGGKPSGALEANERAVEALGGSEVPIEVPKSEPAGLISLLISEFASQAIAVVETRFV